MKGILSFFTPNYFTIFSIYPQQLHWDKIIIDIPNRSFSADLTDEELEERRTKMDELGPQAWTPRGRNRVVSAALRAYAALTTSAARGASRDVSQVERFRGN